MLSYFLSNWRFKKCFERDGDGFLYRRRPTSAPIRITSEEREDFLRRFRKAYWRDWIIVLAGIFLFVLCVSVPFVLLSGDIPDSVVIGTGYGLAGLMLVAILVLDRRRFDSPTKHLAGRVPAAPPSSRSDLRNDVLRKAKWRSMILSGIIFAAIAWLIVPSSTSPAWYPFAWTGYFGLFFGLWARNVWRKYKIDHADGS